MLCNWKFHRKYSIKYQRLYSFLPRLYSFIKCIYNHNDIFDLNLCKEPLFSIFLFLYVIEMILNIKDISKELMNYKIMSVYYINIMKNSGDVESCLNSIRELLKVNMSMKKQIFL